MFAQGGLLLTELSPQPGVDLLMRTVLSRGKYSFIVVLRQDATAVKPRPSQESEPQRAPQLSSGVLKALAPPPLQVRGMDS